MKKLLVFLLKCVVSAVLIYILISSLDLQSFRTQLGRVSIPLFSAAILLFFASNLLGAAQWFVFLRSAGFSMTYGRSTAYYYTGLFFNNFLLSSVGGDAVRLVDVARGEGQHAGRVAATILADRVFGLVCLLVLGNLAFLGYLLFFPHSAPLVYWAYCGLDVFLALLVIVFLSRRIRFLLLRLVRRVPWRLVKSLLFRFLRLLARYSKRRRVFLQALPWGVANQLIKISVSILTAWALGYRIDLVLFFVFVPLLGVVKVLPISIMGLGPHEFTGQKLFATAGIGATVSVSFLLLYQLVVMAANLACGLFFLFRKERTVPGGAG